MALTANLALLTLPPTRPWAWSAGAITGGLWAMYLYARDDEPRKDAAGDTPLRSTAKATLDALRHGVVAYSSLTE